MEIKAELIQPYTEEERIDFIIEENHNKGYEIRYVDTTYEVEETQITYETQEEEYQDIEYIEEIIEEPVLDEEGNEQLDEDGNVITIPRSKFIEHPVTKTREIQIPIENKVMVTKEGQNLQAWGYTEEEKQAQEKEAIKKLTCTKRVFALMLKELGVDYLTQLKPLIESNSQAQLEWDLCVELLRENPMLDVMASQLSITSEQLDKLFQYSNGQITKEEFIPQEEENESI